jgi:hypothetical protein
MSDQDVEDLVIRLWGLLVMFVGGMIGWQLHGIFH